MRHIYYINGKSVNAETYWKTVDNQDRQEFLHKSCIKYYKEHPDKFEVLFSGKIGVCCYIKRAEESVRYTHSVVFILHWISINYGMPYIGFRFKIGACCYTCVKRYQTSIRNRSMLLQS